MENSEIETVEEKGWLAPVAIIWVACAITCFVAIATVFSIAGMSSAPRATRWPSRR